MHASTVPDLASEWLEADGLGGFASGTVGGFRTRRYHALLLTATNPPAGRMVLVNGFDAWIETPVGTTSLSSQYYAPGVFAPTNPPRLVAFSIEPWPTWIWQVAKDVFIEQELFVVHGQSLTCLSWKLIGQLDHAVLNVRPFFSGRDYHSLHHENPAFRFEPVANVNSAGSLIHGSRDASPASEFETRQTFRPYDGVPAISLRSNCTFIQEPLWYRQFLYSAEQERGLDCLEDLATPGKLVWSLTSETRAVWMLAGEGDNEQHALDSPSVIAAYEQHRQIEIQRRKAFATPLLRAADAYLVRRGAGKTIVAGYPWFTDWGRDTFISMRGLCLATGRLCDAGALLDAWTETVSAGMLPNRFPDHGDQPEYNSVDASLWFVIAAYEYLDEAQSRGQIVDPQRVGRLNQAITAILQGYANGTRYGIHCDADALLSAGVPGVQLTWMDAKVGDWVVTPRIGKPVEIQALWLNALALAGRMDARWRRLFDQGLQSFREKFWNPETNCLYDVIDVDHEPDQVDPAVRPNQIFAVGGLPIVLIEGDRARRIVDEVESQLLTPLGLRTLSPHGHGYASQYRGDARQRDATYHQGTVWPWLMGSFAEAWVNVRGKTPSAIQQARQRFLGPLMEHLQHAGLGHVSEIADAESPFTPRGCPFQAWSLGELLRLKLKIFAEK